MDPYRIEEEIGRAVTALCAGNDALALAICDQLAATVSDDPRIATLRAEALMVGEAWEEALAEAARAAEMAPTDAYTRDVLARAEWNAERLTAAQADFELAITLSGREPEYLDNYAWFMAVARGPNLAEAAALEAIKANVKSAVAWAALGWAQLRLRKKGDARRSLSRAFECDKDEPRAHWAMKAVLEETGEHKQAQAFASLTGLDERQKEMISAAQKEVNDANDEIVESFAKKGGGESILDHYRPKKNIWAGIGISVLVIVICAALPLGEGWRMFCMLMAFAMARFFWMTYRDS